MGALFYFMFRLGFLLGEVPAILVSKNKKFREELLLK
jgi:hypothetical protein